MYRLSPLCPFCEATRLLASRSPQWQPVRGAATLQRRKPSRMVLSQRVSKGPQPVSSTRKPVKADKNSPFGGMNVTRAPTNLAATRPMSQAEERRITRNAPDKVKNKDASRDPMKALKMQQRLSSVSYEQRNRIKNVLAERDSFIDFDLLPAIRDSIETQVLQGLTDISPTPIQRLAIPALLGRGSTIKSRRSKGQMQQYLLAAETGSGKTLAYVLPVVDALKRAEAQDKQEAEEEARRKVREAQEMRQAQRYVLETPEAAESNADAARPRAIVLLPTAELVNQVGAVFKSLSHAVKYRTAIISSSNSPTVIRNRLFHSAGVDVVISTPHLLSSIAETNPNVLSRVQQLVIDEADSLLDRSFSPITSAIIDRATPSLKQLVFCSATIPRSLDAYLKKRYPDTWRLATPNLHAIPRRVQLSVVDIDKIPYQGNRNLACAQIIWELGKEEGADHMEKKIIVFVNERETAAEVAGYLQSKGIDAYSFSRDSDQRKNEEILAEFTGAKRHSSESVTANSPADLAETSNVKLTSTRVLVTTDIASRGIDTTPVKHVILYDVPHTSIDFIHRLGRVGRMGRRGRGVVLVGKHDRKDIVSEVRDGMFKGAALI